MRYNGGQRYSAQDFNIRRCIIGENNTKYMPFRTNNRDVIMFHLENADGSGPFGRTSDKTPIKAQIIHLAYMIDMNFDLNQSSRDNYHAIIYYVKSNISTLFSREVATAFISGFKPKALSALQNTTLDNTLRRATRSFSDEYSVQEVRRLATLFAQIIDYKSHYSCAHSIGVAEKAEIMAKFYNFPEEKVAEYYLAGALHDVGKLMIKNSILQKPSALTDEEFELMRGHAYYTYVILQGIKGMDEITKWASHHHEKLNGKGYPFGLTGDKLSHEERLMTCCDIYQALTERRTYKEGFSHSKTLQIMRDMVLKGELDNDIVNDIDYVFSKNGLDMGDTSTSVLST